MSVTTGLRRLADIGRLGAVRRLGWGVADQAVSSVENFVLGVVVARTLGAAALGALGLALMTYAIIVNASRGISTDPLMVRFSGVEEDTWREATRSATGVALLAGLVGAALSATIALVAASLDAPREVVLAFAALAVGLPGMVLQDSWRYAFFSAGRGARAFGNDALWTVLLFAVLGLTASGYTSSAAPVLAFGLTASVAAVFGAWQARTVPAPARAARWLRSHRDIGPRFLVENVTLGASSSVRAYAVAGSSGLAAAGGVRGAEMLVGPVAALLMGISQVAVPEAVRWLARGRDAFLGVCRRLSLGLAAVSFAWGLVLLVVFPFGIGELLLGSVWEGTRELLPGVVLSVTFGTLAIGASAGLRALGRADRSMPTQFVASGLYIGLGVLGAVLGGAQGTVWGTAVAALLGSAVWWWQLLRAERAHFAAHPGPDAEAGVGPG